MRKYILILLILLVSGCSTKELSSGVEMDCDGTITKLEVKENDVLSCKLLHMNSTFTITKVEEEKIVFIVNDKGLKHASKRVSEGTEFTLEKGETLNFTTDTTDIQASVKFSWK